MKINYDQKVDVAKRVKRDAEGFIFFETTEELKAVFTEEEICLMAVRHMKNSEASKESNKKRAAADRLLLKGVKEVSKRMYSKSLDDLKAEEYEAVLREYKRVATEAATAQQ